EAPNWDDIQAYTDHELFESSLAQDFTEPAYTNLPYYGTMPAIQADSESHLALIPTDYSADYAHQTLYRLDALNDFIQTKIQHPYRADGEVLSPEQQLNLRHFSQKIDDLSAKFISKVANHYKTAQLTPTIETDPFVGMSTEDRSTQISKAEKPQKPSKSRLSTNVITFTVTSVIICLIGYSFGL